MTRMQLLRCRSLAMICLALSANAASAQTPKWSVPENYDQGDQTSVAAHPSGLVLEVHRTSAFLGFGLWYHVGQLNGTGVTWGRSQLSPWEGNWPDVVISKEGYVIFVWTTGDSKSRSDLRYAAGVIDPHGGVDQSITWLTPSSTRFDSGFHSSTVINGNGVILDVHESGSGGTGLFYRVGHLTDLAGGNYSIQWDSGTDGVRYDDGINPSIALNNDDEAVEVHQVTGEYLLHYRRGLVYGGRIYFGGSPRYDSDSSHASVALLDSGLVVELHRSDQSRVSARTGILDRNSWDKIIWSDSVVIGSESGSQNSEYPAVATNGTYAIATWGTFTTRIRHLFSSVALLAPEEAFQLEWDLPARVSHRRTHGNAKVRSTAPPKAIKSKSESSGSESPGGNQRKVKERSTAPPKAVQSKFESPGSASPGTTHEKAKDRRSGRAITS